MRDYSYFSYYANEALHLSGQERKTVIECMERIKEELQYPIDKHSKSLITDNIKLFLILRHRQFITRENTNQDTFARFEALLNEYFNSGKPALYGIPSVPYCSEKLCLSPNYLSDLLKKETGLSALKHIQQKTLEIAKERVYNTKR